MPNKKAELQSKESNEQRMASVSTSFSGPIPPPGILEGYENIHPGTADRIIKMAEQQSSHRQDIEKKVIASNVQNERTGMWLAFALTLLLMVFGFFLILNDKSIAGYFAVFGPIIFHAGNYVYNKHKEQKSIADDS